LVVVIQYRKRIKVSPVGFGDIVTGDEFVDSSGVIEAEIGGPGTSLSVFPP
jgi:hypothetical protein